MKRSFPFLGFRSAKRQSGRRFKAGHHERHRKSKASSCRSFCWPRQGVAFGVLRMALELPFENCWEILRKFTFPRIASSFLRCLEDDYDHIQKPPECQGNANVQAIIANRFSRSCTKLKARKQWQHMQGVMMLSRSLKTKRSKKFHCFWYYWHLGAFSCEDIHLSSTASDCCSTWGFIFNLKGPNYVADTACSASLTATHLVTCFRNSQNQKSTTDFWLWHKLYGS